MAKSQQLLSTKLKETWTWIIYPYQEAAQDDISFEFVKLQSQDRIFENSQKLEDTELCFQLLRT